MSTYPRPVTAKLFDSDFNEISGALDNSFARQFTDVGSDFGSGTCSLGREDPNVDELIRGRYVQILVGGTPRFTFKIQGSPRLTEIEIGEEIREAVTVSGLGWGCLFHEAVFHPEPGVESPLDYSKRLWSFASINFDASTWNPAVEHYEYRDGVTVGLRVEAIVDPGPDPDDPGDDVLKLYPAPKDFPWPNAYYNGNPDGPEPTYVPTYWVIGDGAADAFAVGWHFFRGSFTLAGRQEMTFFCTGDNLFQVFLQGVPIIEELSDTWVWRGWKPITLSLPAGTYTFAAAVENIAWSDTNPGGGLFNVIATSVFPGDTATSLTLSLLSSSAADLPESFFSTDVWPGWTAGQIIVDFVAEAQAQGALVLYAGDTFSDTLDTGGETFPPIPIFGMDIGQTLGEALIELCEQNHIDWHFHPDTLTLDVWVKGEAGSVSGVDFYRPTDPDDPESGNLRSLQRGEVKPYANYLLVQYSGGTTVVQDTTEQTAYGSVVQGFLRTEAATLDEATTLGLAELALRKLSALAGITVEIQPTSAADCPYEGFDMFDFVTTPQADGSGTDSVQVLSIDLSEDDEGFAFWRLELNQRPRAPERELLDAVRWAVGVGFGSSGGRGTARP